MKKFNLFLIGVLLIAFIRFLLSERKTPVYDYLKEKDKEKSKS